MTRPTLPERFHALAMKLLPRRFVDAYGADLQADFRMLIDDARGNGKLHVIYAAAGSTTDVVRTAIRERLRRNNEHSFGRSPRGRRPQPGEAAMRWLTEMKQAARTLARKPGFTTASIVTLGLGIGANVAIFAVIDAVLIRPLPYPESDRIVLVEHEAPGIGFPTLGNSEKIIGFYRQNARSFAHFARIQGGSRNMTGGDQPARVQILEVSPNFFDVIGVMPERGVRFQVGDGTKGGEELAIVTGAGARAHFAGRSPIGETVMFDRVPVRIVGVMPSDFKYRDTDVHFLLARELDPNGLFGAFGITGLGRLADNATLESAQRELETLQPRFREMEPDLPATFFEQAKWKVVASTLRDTMVNDVKTTLWIVFATVGFVLLIACANVANLFLVRAESRQKEVAVRSALGATRGRLSWNFLSESLLLGLAGGVLGTAIAAIGVRLLIATGPAQIPRISEIAIGPRTIVFAMLVSVIAGLMFGLLPLPRLMRAGYGTSLREGRTDTGSRERHALRKSLIAAQVALALILLTGSGLMLRSFAKLRAVDPGFRAENLIDIGISYGSHPSRMQVAQFYQSLADEIANLPGTTAVTITNAIPVAPAGLNGGGYTVVGEPEEDDVISPTAMYTAIGDNYFRAMGIKLIKGRDIERRDVETESNVAWVNEAFVRGFRYPGEVVGRSIEIGGATLEIVGVIADVRTFGLDQDTNPMVHFAFSAPVRSAANDLAHIMVRTDASLEALTSSVRSIMQRRAPEVPVTVTRRMEDVVRNSMVTTTFTMTILSIAAIVALLLGSVGLYGVITYVVAQRTREIGVRVALGASPTVVSGMVLRQGMIVVIVGVLIGTAASLALTRLMSSLLYGVSAYDPLTFVSVIVALAAVSATATYLPARRAASIDPLTALRGD